MSKRRSKVVGVMQTRVKELYHINEVEITREKEDKWISKQK